MQNQLLEAVVARHRRPGESDATLLQRLRLADSQLTALYRRNDVDASAGYDDPLVRAAYLLRYMPHYTLQLGDLLRDLEGDPDVARLFCRPLLRHASLCGGPAPEAIALAVLHAQAGGQQLHSMVLDRQAQQWSDCWEVAASIAHRHCHHPSVVIEGHTTNLARICSPQERDLLNGCQLLTLMNAFNELMLIGSDRLQRQLEMRLACLKPGALVLIGDQANYVRCQQGMALLRRMLEAMGARILIARTCLADAAYVANRFQLHPKLRTVYGRSGNDGGPQTKLYRINNTQLQLAAVLPGG